MKFLGWMHRKLTHDSKEPMKNSTIGKPCSCFPVQTLFDEQIYCGKPTKALARSNINCQKSSNRFGSNKVEVLFQEESFEPFEYLAIGTFGMELFNTDPPISTPTLPVPTENLTNQQIKIREDNLKLINYELEKFLEAEEKEIANDTSERSSHASIITLSNKPIEGADSESHTYFMTCPLQNSLFVTSTEVAKPDKEVKKEKTSLAELFKRNDIANDDPMRRSTGAEQQTRKRSITHFMKKVMKKFHSSSISSKAYSKNEATTSISMKKKLSKDLKMLHMKVYPEDMAEKQFVKMQKSDRKDIPYQDVSRIEGRDENELVGQLCSTSICRSAPAIDGGHWIKTDSDYLVLEL